MRLLRHKPTFRHFILLIAATSWILMFPLIIDQVNIYISSVNPSLLPKFTLVNFAQAASTSVEDELNGVNVDAEDALAGSEAAIAESEAARRRAQDEAEKAEEARKRAELDAQKARQVEHTENQKTKKWADQERVAKLERQAAEKRSEQARSQIQAAEERMKIAQENLEKVRNETNNAILERDQQELAADKSREQARKIDVQLSSAQLRFKKTRSALELAKKRNAENHAQLQKIKKLNNKQMLELKAKYDRERNDLQVLYTRLIREEKLLRTYKLSPSEGGDENGAPAPLLLGSEDNKGNQKNSGKVKDVDEQRQPSGASTSSPASYVDP